MAELKQEPRITHRVKEEPESPQVKEEECPFTIVTVKTEDDEDKPSELHQTPTEENQEETDKSSSDTEDDGQQQPPTETASRRPFSCSESSAASRRPFSCSDCGKTFRCNSELQVHTLRHAEKKPFICSVCEKGFVRKSDLCRHCSRAHHVCPVCSERLSDQPELNRHLRTHVEDGTLDRTSHLVRETVKPFSCTECGLTFRWHSHLQSHVSSVHRGERHHQCGFCGKSFSFRSHLQSHVLVHTGERPHSCSVCGKTFILKTTLNQHLKIHAGEKPFVCSVCEKGFLVKKDFTWHQTFVHHICPVCSEHFTDKNSLGEHLRTHTEEGALDPASALFRGVAKPFSCSDCGKSFTKNSDLKRHMFSHTGERPHQCPLCENSFNQKSSLKQHMKIHAGEKPFSCSVCEKGFLVKKDHTWHQAFVHHICPVCPQHFTDRSGLGEHLRTHAAGGALDPASALFRGIARPFSCSDCGKSFTKNSDLKRHTVSHTGEKPHSSSAS